MDTHKEKRLMEAFAQYEAGQSLASLQAVFSDVAVELNQMAEAQEILKEGKEAMRPSPELSRKIVAALALQSSQKTPSIFMSSLWRLVAPVGVAALALMFILAGGQNVQPIIVATQSMDMMAVRGASPMMAKNAQTSLMAVAPEQDGVGMVEAEPVNPEVMNRAITDADTLPFDSLYILQMLALGLLVILSILVLIKHWLVRRR